MKTELIKSAFCAVGSTVCRWLSDRPGKTESRIREKLSISPDAYSHDDLRMSPDERPPATFDTILARTRRSFE